MYEINIVLHQLRQPTSFTLHDEPVLSSPADSSVVQSELNVRLHSPLSASHDAPHACDSVQIHFLQEVEKVKRVASEKCRQGDFQEAIGLYTKALELKPDYAELLVNRCYCHFRCKSYCEAVCALTRPCLVSTLSSHSAGMMLKKN
jgi:tetratricopeptide (TPR) repeat protein